MEAMILGRFLIKLTRRSTPHMIMDGISEVRLEMISAMIVGIAAQIVAMIVGRFSIRDTRRSTPH